MAKPKKTTSNFRIFILIVGFLFAAVAFGAAIFFSGGLALPFLGPLLFAKFAPLIAAAIGGLTFSIVALSIGGAAVKAFQAFFSRFFKKENVLQETLTDPIKMAEAINNILTLKTPYTKDQLPKLYKRLDFPIKPDSPTEGTNLQPFNQDRNEEAVCNGAIKGFQYFTKSQVNSLFSQSLILQVSMGINQLFTHIQDNYVSAGVDLSEMNSQGEPVNTIKMHKEIQTALITAKPALIEYIIRELPHTFQSHLAIALRGKTPEKDLGQSDPQRNQNLMKAIGVSESFLPDDMIRHIAACIFKIQSDMRTALETLCPAPKNDPKNTAFVEQWQSIEKKLNQYAKTIIEDYQEVLTKNVLQKTLTDPSKMTTSINTFFQPKTLYTSEQLPVLYKQLDSGNETRLNSSLLVRNNNIIKRGAMSHNFEYFTEEQVSTLFSPSLALKMAMAISNLRDDIYIKYRREGDAAGKDPNRLNAQEDRLEDLDLTDQTLLPLLATVKPIIIEHIIKELPNTFQVKLMQAIRHGEDKEACVKTIKDNMKTALAELSPSEDFESEWVNIEKKLNACAEKTVGVIHQIDTGVNPGESPAEGTGEGPSEPPSPHP